MSANHTADQDPFLAHEDADTNILNEEDVSSNSSLRRSYVPVKSPRISEDSDPGTEADDEKGRLTHRLRSKRALEADSEILADRKRCGTLSQANPILNTRDDRGRRLTHTVIETCLVAGLLAKPCSDILWSEHSSSRLSIKQYLSGMGVIYATWLYSYGNLKRDAGGDSGSFLYPTLLPLLAPTSLECEVDVTISNLVLGVSSLPHLDLPKDWPLVWLAIIQLESAASSSFPELYLLPYVHQALCETITSLVSTSLEPSEVGLLSIGLLNLLQYSESPQMCILTIILWLGGMLMMIFCQVAIKWEATLYRLPSQILRVNTAKETDAVGIFRKLLDATLPSEHWSDHNSSALRSDEEQAEPTSSKPKASHKHRSSNGTSVKHRRVGRSKSSFLTKLTNQQARALKLLLAVYISGCTALIILLPVRYYVAKYAFYGSDPFGWAIGYLFGDIEAVRIFVVSDNWGHWIQLPPHRVRTIPEMTLGWMDWYRQHDLGAANTRLLISLYCIIVLTSGIYTVVRLRTRADTDTRRKVFHGVMVIMLLPTIPIDPCFISLALIVVLGIFLLLDIFRAGHIPPISKPLNRFLAPYIDDRDRRGSVTVSPVFLLIGCAVPLWLSLAGMSRSGSWPDEGWEVQERDISMVAGVVCVGMGDAAASLVGRRYGRTKWYWSRRKSVEGSAAFALAVAIGLLASLAWIKYGGWLERDIDWLTASTKAVLAGLGASLMESVLTAANDNVLVPVVLWVILQSLEL